MEAAYRNIEQVGSDLTLRRHARVFLPQALLTVGFGALIALATELAGLNLDHGQRWALVSLGFLLSWWVVYFSSRRFELPSLRTFLDDKSQVRWAAMHTERDGDGEAEGGNMDPASSTGQDAASHDRAEHNDPVLTKAAFSVGAQGIFIAIIALFLTLVLQDARGDDYHDLLRFLSVLIALITILLMIFAIDILDTVANPFRAGERTPDQYRQWFYRKIGPGGPSGGISYAYFGFASFSVFIIVAMAFFFPAMAGLGIATYAYLGYPLFFGFRKVSSKEEKDLRVEIDEKAPVISRGYGIALLTATLLVAVT